MNIIKDLTNIIGETDSVFIQTHDFPDHDAVASAFGLQHLLAEFDVSSRIVYEGTLERNSLKRMIDELGIQLECASHYGLKPEHKIIIVDGCKGNKNVTELIGKEISVVDHHQILAPDDVAFADIRPNYGACATLIHSYYNELEMEIPRAVATALLVGINIDTALLTRGVSEADLRAYVDLYELADVHLQNSILRNYIQARDLHFFQVAIDNLKRKDSIGFCYLPDGCNQNLLAILADFFLALQELDFVVMCARNDDVVNLSVRSERQGCDASSIVKDILKGIGFGGGHRDMAGGIVYDASRFDAVAVFELIAARVTGSVSTA
ncbi:bifunctional oligoribonuclease/PAP phosphatase NrnA [Candidatus Hydrogenedentota bacterium]